MDDAIAYPEQYEDEDNRKCTMKKESTDSDPISPICQFCVLS